ncbi:hypothetical protein BEL04_11830 [Mucilaginibacter sp. PPCGB 2223]|uniref:hypothetical protein n=1 Tax=Mucilaginibacter sp. PPCGB 2223 TaxID=1886027 RepID=UPI00082611F6|nr:hypothetical protein [Mucilaginibacter sp. PPCGB 2223]OCX52172.1 hypothetical protein BEL04_11830 [Mucilaginibacter sp. PPCGB 2223]
MCFCIIFEQQNITYMPAAEPVIGKPGKHPAKTDARTLNYVKYLKVDMPGVPAACDWTAKKKSRWGAMKNLHLHDCTLAAAGHMIQCWTLNIGEPVLPPDSVIVKAYSALTGYDPKTGANDKGATALDALKYWRKNGIGGHEITAFATVNHHTKKYVTEAIFLFGGIYVGVQLPATIKGQKVWELSPDGPVGDGAPGSYGGHAICVLAYDEKGLTCISWGKKRRMTWDFWFAYAEEAYAVLSHSFIKNNKTPQGFDLDSLKEDLMNITQQKVRLAAQLSGDETGGHNSKDLIGQDGSRGG